MTDQDTNDTPDPLRGAPAAATMCSCGAICSCQATLSDKILQSAGFAVYCWNLESDTIDWSDNADKVLDVPIETVATGRSYRKLIDTCAGKTPADLVQHADVADSGLGIAFSTDYAFVPWRGADPVWLQDTGRWYKNGAHSGEVHGVIRRIDRQIAELDQLQRLSKFDEVTGQLNRTHLMAALSEAIEELVVTRKPMAFLVLAIDHFDRLNDAFGFDVGDQVIGGIARRVRSQMRGPDSIGRLSGNKIGVVLQDCDVNAASTAADRFIECVRSSVIETDCGAVPATISVGAAMLPRYADTAERAVAGALEALHDVQSHKVGSLSFYQPTAQEIAKRKANARVGDQIVDALNDRRVTIALMPVADLSTGGMAFHECLVRIVRADGTTMPAAEFVPVAERLGYIRLLDHRVLELGLKALETDHSLTLSINVSPITAADPEYLSKIVAGLVKRSDLAKRLIVELTETEAIKSLDETTGFVTTLHELGVRVAIDDFGAGYTSFRTLQSLAIDIVKIDGGFISEMADTPADRAFVQALTDLARALDIEVVAEGVHDQRALAAVKAIGVTLVQGFGIGPAEMIDPEEDDGTSDESADPSPGDANNAAALQS